MKRIAGLSFVAVAVVASCASDSGGTQYDQYITRNGTISADIANQSPTAAMPTTFTGNYTGIAVLSVQTRGDVFAGVADIDVDFTSPGAAASGTLSKFIDDQDVSKPGTLAITGGVITGNNITMRAAGNLRDGNRTVAVDVNMDGTANGGSAFYGNNAQFLSVSGIGTATYGGAILPDPAALAVLGVSP